MARIPTNKVVLKDGRVVKMNIAASLPRGCKLYIEPEQSEPETQEPEQPEQVENVDEDLLVE